MWSVLLNSKHRDLIDIITVNMMSPLDSFWRLETTTKEMQPRVIAASLTIPLPLIVIILIKRSIAATWFFRMQKLLQKLPLLMEIIRRWKWYSNSKNAINYAESRPIWQLASMPYSSPLLPRVCVQPALEI